MLRANHDPTPHPDHLHFTTPSGTSMITFVSNCSAPSIQPLRTTVSSGCDHPSSSQLFAWYTSGAHRTVYAAPIDCLRSLPTVSVWVSVRLLCSGLCGLITLTGGLHPEVRVLRVHCVYCSAVIIYTREAIGIDCQLHAVRIHCLCAPKTTILALGTQPRCMAQDRGQAAPIVLHIADTM